MKKIMFAALALAAVTLTLASCGNSEKQAEDAAADSAAAAAADSSVVGVVEVEQASDTIGDTIVTATQAVGVVAQQ